MVQPFKRRGAYKHSGAYAAGFSSKERQDFIRKLPRLEEKDVAPGKSISTPLAHHCNIISPDDTCAICQETFLAIIATEEMASVMETPGLPEEDMGVVKLPECGHRFCRKEYVHKSRSSPLFEYLIHFHRRLHRGSIATWVYSSVNKFLLSIDYTY